MTLVQQPSVALAALASVSAFAQSSVSITGYFGGSFDQFSISNANASRTGNSKENRVSDQSSRLLFNVNEDLGGGLTAIGQYDLRFKVDAAARIQGETATSTTTATGTGTPAAATYKTTTVNNPAVDPVTNGNIHVGLRSKDWGSLKLGRQDIHYTEQAISILPGGLYLAANQAPVAYAVGSSTIANWSRTPNLVWFESNRYDGFQGSLGYSTNPTRSSATSEVENGVGSSVAQRAASGKWVKLNYANGPLDLTYSRYEAKSGYVGSAAYGTNTGSAGTNQNAQADQLSSTLLAKYQVTPALRAALGYTQNTATQVAANTTLADTAFAYTPVYAVGDKVKNTATHAALSYDMGKNNFGLAYAKRGNTSYAGVDAADTGVKQVSAVYTYNFSKNTAAGVMYTKQSAQANAVTPGLFYQGNNAYGGQLTGMRGENQSITSVALRTNF